MKKDISLPSAGAVAVRALIIKSLLLGVFLALFVSLAQAPLQADDKIGLSYQGALGGIVLHAAIELGYFKEEGLEVEPIFSEVEEIPGLLQKGKIVGGELNYTLYELVGKGIGVTAGLYSGFLELIGEAPQKGQKIVVVSESPASGPAVAAARELRSKGIDSIKDVTWREEHPDRLLASLKAGEATLLARWGILVPGSGDPGLGHGGHGAQAAAGGGDKPPKGESGGHGGHGGGDKPPQGESGGHGGHGAHSNEGQGGQAAMECPGAPESDPKPQAGVEGQVSQETQTGGFKVVYSARASLPKDDGGGKSANPHAKHTAADHFFDSFAYVSQDLYEKDPEKAAAITRALIRGAIWAGENTDAAADLGIRLALWEGDKAELVALINSFMWMPGVKHAKEHIKLYIHEWVARGLFPGETDENKIFEAIFIQALPDVN
jgi:ABC-type nitrate/sulfonate/bicarbonate transport system substrate-binding protein